MFNFKKSKNFKHPEENIILGNFDETVKSVAVWGSQDSGKTTIAINLAKHLASKKKNVVVVFCDFTTPMLNCVIPNGEIDNLASIGSIFASISMTENLIKTNLVTLKKSNYLTFLGFKNGENEYLYPEIDGEKSLELLENLNKIFDYVIMDCSSHISNSALSVIALKKCDKVIRIVNQNLKSISYFNSQLTLLNTNEWKEENQVKVLNNIKTEEPIDRIFESYFVINHCDEVWKNFADGNLIKDLKTKDGSNFNERIEKFCKELKIC